MDPQLKDDVYQQAQACFASNPTWADFFREVLGVGGKMRTAFQKEDLIEFQRTPEYRDILQMLTALRKKKPKPEDPKEEERVITVRLPKSMHTMLAEEAHERRTTVNKLCISKLLQGIEQELIPVDKEDKKKQKQAAQEPMEATA